MERLAVVRVVCENFRGVAVYAWRGCVAAFLSEHKAGTQCGEEEGDLRDPHISVIIKFGYNE